MANLQITREPIPVSAVTVGSGSVTGTGIFDEFMKAIVAHLEVEYNARRISSEQYPQIYLGGMQEALKQAVEFAIGAKKLEYDNALSAANICLIEQKCETEKKQQALIAAQTITESKQPALVEANTSLVNAKTTTEGKNPNLIEAQTDLVVAQEATEGKKKLLVERQTKGFDDDAKNKLLKQLMDGWSIAYTVAKDNSVPQSISLNVVDKVAKNSMSSLGIDAPTFNP